MKPLLEKLTFCTSTISTHLSFIHYTAGPTQLISHTVQLALLANYFNIVEPFYYAYYMAEIMDTSTYHKFDSVINYIIRHSSIMNIQLEPRQAKSALSK